ncbi:hypothetical protein PQU92_17250 [Asticcacaulis sp. BYS171W]|uniref:Uncharacterized protein n=1 Tax=Asticcacaulis aquaticus TaxID=2984212 RepID=A0ABT5HY84_9CAUL|nr:hypothetical protein [Asticcacaulis aquaticus]MDC7685034.1 hypothetical protein [Asticcacaulis aquaticus]
MHRQGFRYTRNDASLPGRPHFYLPKFRAVVFVCNCDSAYGFEHDCYALREKSEGHLAAEEENTRLLDLVTVAVEKLGVRVEVVFRCQLDDADGLAASLKAFLEGGETYSGRDPLSWYHRQGDLSKFGLEGALRERFLVPVVISDPTWISKRQIFIGRLGGDHAQIVGTISKLGLNRVGELKFGFTDRSGAFLNKVVALKYAIRHSLVPERLLSMSRELDCNDLNTHSPWRLP